MHLAPQTTWFPPLLIVKVQNLFSKTCTPWFDCFYPIKVLLLILYFYFLYINALDVEKVLQLYESSHTTQSILEILGATILHGVDVTTMKKHDTLRRTRFHIIVYNFPHVGFYRKEGDKKVIKFVF